MGRMAGKGHLSSNVVNSDRVPETEIVAKPQATFAGLSTGENHGGSWPLRQSRTWKGCPKLMRMLDFVVEATVGGEAAYLKERPSRVFVFSAKAGLRSEGRHHRAQPGLAASRQTQEVLRHRRPARFHHPTSRAATSTFQSRTTIVQRTHHHAESGDTMNFARARAILVRDAPVRTCPKHRKRILARTGNVMQQNESLRLVFVDSSDQDRQTNRQQGKFAYYADFAVRPIFRKELRWKNDAFRQRHQVPTPAMNTGPHCRGRFFPREPRDRRSHAALPPAACHCCGNAQSQPC